MSYRAHHVWILAIVSGMAAVSAAEEKARMELHVALTGNDAWDGSRDRPLATLEAARDKLRETRRSGRLPASGATVLLHGSTYERAKPFELTAEDSGREDAPIVYRAFENDRTELIGGKRVGPFTPVKDPTILERLEPAARGKVLQCDLRACGVSDFGRLSRRGFGGSVTPAHLELFVNGERMTLARWPNDGFTRIAGIPAGAGHRDEHGGTLGKLDAGFLYEGDRPSRWKSPEDIWVHGYWAWDWANSYEAVESIDTAKRLVKTRPPGGTYGFRTGQRLYFLNVLEELDQPGEYYLDRKTGILCLWPPQLGPEIAAVVSVLETPLIHLKGASHVVIRGLQLGYTRGHAIVMEGGSRDLVAGCELANIGNYAAIADGGTSHNILSCDIHDTGDGGISLSGGDRKTLAPGGHSAVNNHIHHIGQWSRCYQPAVGVSGVGHRVAHNLIHDGPHNAVQLGGNENLIEFNEMFRLCTETGDVGAFYMGRDWTMRGNIVRHNFFHHLGGVGMGSMAVYLDDCSSGSTVFGNVFYKVTRAAFIGGGRDNTVENNIFVDCDPAVCIDGRGLDRSPVWHDMVYKTMKERLDAMSPHQPPYRDRYRKLAELDAYYAKDAGIPPEGNVVARNVCVRGQWLQVHWHAKPEMIAVRDNLVGADPLFVDEAKMDFRLREDSPAYKLGFQRIPIEKIGLFTDEHRRSLPQPPR